MTNVQSLKCTKKYHLCCNTPRKKHIQEYCFSGSINVPNELHWTQFQVKWVLCNQESCKFYLVPCGGVRRPPTLLAAREGAKPSIFCIFCLTDIVQRM